MKDQHKAEREALQERYTSLQRRVLAKYQARLEDAAEYPIRRSKLVREYQRELADKAGPIIAQLEALPPPPLEAPPCGA